jgi:hypothetical protein
MCNAGKQMPGIFISHSSKDKPFVTKLAMDLVSRDIPVWFDKWELETGDSLIRRIYDSIDESSYLLIVLSSSSSKSKWVERELTAALTKEEQIKRTFVIPIKIDECPVPLSVADRLYADFTGSYLSALESLIATIKKFKVNEIEVPSEQQLIPIIFSRGIYLRETPLEQRVESVLRTAAVDFQFSDDQFVVSSDETYLKLRDNLIQRMENIEDDPFYTPEFERTFSADYSSLFTYEQNLINGIVLILNEGLMSRRLDLYECVRACHWYARIVRTNLYRLLYRCQFPAADDLIALKAEWKPSLTDNISAAAFFEVADVASIDFGPEDLSTYVHIWVDMESEMIKDWNELQVRLPLIDYLNPELIYKYIVPQMIDLYLINHDFELLWDFNHYVFGRH